MSQAADDMMFCLKFLQQANAEFPGQVLLARALHGAQLMEAALDNLTSTLHLLPTETQAQIGRDMKEILDNHMKGLH